MRTFDVSFKLKVSHSPSRTDKNSTLNSAIGIYSANEKTSTQEVL